MWTGALAGALLLGCASANVKPPGGDDDDVPIDAPDPIDMFQPDAPIMATLQQTTNTTNASNNSIVCNTNGELSWYRVFVPSEHGVTGGFRVSAVNFGVQETLPATPPSISVKVGTYSGDIGQNTLDLASITVLAQTVATAPANTLTPGINSIVAPVVALIPPGENLVVEINVINNLSGNSAVAIGASNGGEMRHGYYRSPPCGTTVPTRPSTVDPVDFPNVHLNITVSGTR